MLVASKLSLERDFILYFAMGNKFFDVIDL